MSTSEAFNSTARCREQTKFWPRRKGTHCRHRSHFGSRYKTGCCGHAGLLHTSWFESRLPISETISRFSLAARWDRPPSAFRWPSLATARVLRLKTQCNCRYTTIIHVCSVSKQSLSAQCPLRVRALSAHCPLGVRSVSAQSPLGVRSLSAQCPLGVRSVSAQCPLSVRLVSAHCPLIVRSVSGDRAGQTGGIPPKNHVSPERSSFFWKSSSGNCKIGAPTKSSATNRLQCTPEGERIEFEQFFGKVGIRPPFSAI